MSQLGRSSRAAFVNGHYRIGADLSATSASVAACHEEAHGIIRRSTLYGFLLSSVLAPTSAVLRADDIVAHGLLSRGRTSEEVFATFYSITMAAWAGVADAATRELTQFPEYAYYYDIGTEFTVEIDSLHSKMWVLDGITRFCWSSQHIAEYLTRSARWPNLRVLPPTAFPDNRMSRLRIDWPQYGGIELRAALERRYPQLELLRDRSLSEICDPLHDTKKALGKDTALLMGADCAKVLADKRFDMALRWAALGEKVATFVSDYFADRYHGTSMAAWRTAEISNFINSEWRKTAPAQNNNPKMVGIIERVDNLEKKRRVRLHPKLEWEKGYELPIVGVRSWESFTGNFELPEELEATRGAETEAIYATAHSLVRNSHEHSLGSELPLALLSDRKEDLAFALVEWLPLPAIVAIWTSIMLRDREAWSKQLRSLADAHYKVWLVVDTEPQIVVQATRSFLPEVNGFFYAPLRSRPNVGGLVVRCLENPISNVVRGLVFPGLQHTAAIIVELLQRELGENFRGMNALEVFEETMKRRREGETLVEWLIGNEHQFSYLMPS